MSLEFGPPVLWGLEVSAGSKKKHEAGLQTRMVISYEWSW